MNGHKFVQKQFYQLILCAFCNDFLLNALGYQCEDCRYTCHKKCYEKVVTKCISKSNTGVRFKLFTFSFYLSNVLRKVTRRKLIIVSLTVSKLSPIWEHPGVAIADTCYLSVARTPANVLSARSLATQTVPISFPTFAACLWKTQIVCLPTGAISINIDRPPPNPLRRHPCFLRPALKCSPVLSTA